MDKNASLWDRPRPTLDREVWDNGKLKPQHKAFILGVLSDAFDAVGFENYDSWVKKLIIAGSIASYQYNSESDVDVDIVVDLAAIVEMEYGGGVDKYAAKEVLEAIKKDIRGKEPMLPGTSHPFEPFFIYEGDPDAKTALPKNVGLYSILEDKWLTEPKEVDLSGSVETLYPELMEFVWSLAQKYNLSIMEMRQDVVDVSYLRDALGQFPPKFQAVIEKEISSKLDEINGEIDQILKDTEELYEERYSGPYPVMPAEVQFTYLRRYGYLWLMKEIQSLKGGRENLEEVDLEGLGDVLKEVPKY